MRPDFILSSPARRALSTAGIIAKELNYRAEDIVVNERLYATDADMLLGVNHAVTWKGGSETGIARVSVSVEHGQVADLMRVL